VNVLIACEFSGILREAFRRLGHDAVSCDLLHTEIPGPHIRDDVFRHLDDGWDMMIFFWPCTNMAISGARWFHAKREQQARDIESFRRLAECPIPKTAGENPIGVLSTRYRKPDQIIQPWMFGHGETKATCLWLKGLRLLTPTNIVTGRHGRVWREAPSPDRWKKRSRMLPGIADAMAEQWGGRLIAERLGDPKDGGPRQQPDNPYPQK
jgi:hypothetical protein